jgi:hypothetical protein
VFSTSVSATRTSGSSHLSLDAAKLPVSRPTSIFFVAAFRRSKNSSPSPREPGRSYSDECSVVVAWVLGCSVCNG